MTKACFRCAVVKEHGEFYTVACSKTGLSGVCKACFCEAAKKWRLANPEHAARRIASKYWRNPKQRLAGKRWNEKNSEKRKAIARKYASSGRGKEKGKAWRDANTDKLREYAKRSRLKHREANRVKNLNRRHSDIGYRIRVVLRTNLAAALRRHGGKKKRPTLVYLGCSIPDFKVYLESKFEPGMSWNNYGINGWHIDHIMPCAIFDLSRQEHLRRCFHFSNLQPMWGEDNRRKSDKIVTNQFNLL